MKVHYKLALVLLAGAALGAAATQALHAQAKPPVYAVIDISEITDPEGYKEISGRSDAAAAQVFRDLGGRYLARNGQITAVDGTPPNRFVITAFDSAEKAQAWTKLPAQQQVTAVRTKTTKSRVFLVEGQPPQ